MAAADGMLDEEYDVALLGTSLPLSILSAALSRAGLSVLHIDDAEHYGGPWASLTLEEWTQKASSLGTSISFDYASNDVQNELQKVSRHFSISLAPTLLPCAGPTIDVLVRSHVASYCTFRLLEQTVVYSNEGRAKDAWPLRRVPSSKEDIFKEKSLSLVDKRRLMKLLQRAAPPRPATEGDEEDRTTTQGETDRTLQGKSFYGYLTSTDEGGPGFSQRLASDVAYGVAMCASADESASLAMRRVQRHILSVGRYGNSAYLVGQYGGAGEMAQCFCRSSAVQGGTFVLAHAVRDLCRLDGKQTGKWQLSLTDIEGSTKVGYVIGDADLLQRIDKSQINDLVRPSTKPRTLQALGILLLDRAMCLSLVNNQTSTAEEGSEDNQSPGTAQPPPPPPPETALVVFPPSDDSGGESSQGGSVWALQMGEGTFSCPKGTYLVYLCAVLPQPSERMATAKDAKAALHDARQGVLHLARQNRQEWNKAGENASCAPLFESYMTREAVSESSCGNDEEEVQTNGNKEAQMRSALRSNAFLSVPSSVNNVATSLDEATRQAENVFFSLMSVHRLQDVTRTQVEAHRRRQRRAAGSSTFAAGRGLAGAPERQDDGPDTFTDFFPEPDGNNQRDDDL